MACRLQITILKALNRYDFFDIEEPGTDDWFVASGTFDWDVANGNLVSTTSYYTRETDEFEEETTFLHFFI